MCEFRARWGPGLRAAWELLGSSNFRAQSPAWRAGQRGLRTEGSLPVRARPHTARRLWQQQVEMREAAASPTSVPSVAQVSGPPEPGSEPHLWAPDSQGSAPCFWSFHGSPGGMKGPAAQVCSGPFVNEAPVLPASLGGRRGGWLVGSPGWWQPGPLATGGPSEPCQLFGELAAGVAQGRLSPGRKPLPRQPGLTRPGLLGTHSSGIRTPQGTRDQG